MSMNRMFMDTESGELISEDDVFDGYIMNLKDDPEGYRDVSFDDYIAGNPTLEAVETEITILLEKFGDNDWAVGFTEGDYSVRGTKADVLEAINDAMEGRV